MMKTSLLIVTVLGICFASSALCAEELDGARTKTNAPKDSKTKTNDKSAKADDKTPDTNVKQKPIPPLERPSYEPGQVRIKDLADVQGVRGNQLFGYGLIVGLEGTGDGQLSLFTVQSTMNMLRKLGTTLNITPQQLQLKNVAAVMVTADLPAFARKGAKIDVTVSSIGDAKSLQGGVLLQTPLLAANGDVYAAAQGAVSIGGLNISAGGASIQKNFVNVGRIPKGAYVEQDVETNLSENGIVQLTLRDPDFTTASRIADELRKRSYIAQATDPGSVKIGVPQEQAKDLIHFLAEVEAVTVTPDVQARIIINERTGTVVVGGNVRLGPGTISHGSISIKIDNTPIVVPPAPFSNAPGIVIPQNSVEVREEKAKFAPIPTTKTVEQMVSTLSRLGLTPRDLIAVLQAMHRAGMITAQLEVQ
ncbi:MAG: flagellar basal body P-ring protein FlgI [Armatimonadetes bacterium]|nr:flagellar basal body P-ring protein FlgI [Armatimonadota bacterium]